MGSSDAGDNKPHEAHQRRQIISKINVPIEKGIKVLDEYVEGPRGNVCIHSFYFYTFPFLIHSLNIYYIADIHEMHPGIPW